MISVVIPNYNGVKYLRQCVDSVYQEMNNPRCPQAEIIIIDNASTDDGYDWIQEVYPEIIWKRLDRNYGFSKAVNEGIRLASHEYILLLNNDTELCKGYLERLIGAIDQFPKAFAMCSQMIQYHNPHMIDDAGDEYTVLGWGYKRGDGQAVDTYSQVEQVFSACAGAAIYRKSLLEKIGGFDEHFFAYMEDVDISYRARLYGYHNMYCPDAKVLHIGSATSGSKYNVFKVRLAARNNIYVPYKNMPLLQLLINMPFLLIGYLIKYVFFVKKGFGQAYREGFIEGLKTLDKVQKVPFKVKHIPNYIKIEWYLIVNTIRYIKLKLVKA